MITKLSALLAIALVPASGLAQQQPASPPKPAISSFFVDAAKLVAKHPLDKKLLQNGMASLATTYRQHLKEVGNKVTWLEGQAGEKFNQLDLQQKANLLSEFWRIRSSVNLMCLLNADTLKELTGIDISVLNTWVSRVNAVAAKLKKATFGFGQ